MDCQIQCAWRVAGVPCYLPPVTGVLCYLPPVRQVGNVVLKAPPKKADEPPSAVSAAQKARLMAAAGTKGKRTMSSIPTLGGATPPQP